MKTKNTKSEAQQSTNFLRAIIDTVLDPIFVKDRQHRWIEGNKAFWELLGGETNAKGKSDYDFFPKELADKFWAGDERVFAGEMFDEEEKLLTTEGKELDIATKKMAFTMASGEQGLVGVIRDVTQQRKIEAELRRNRDSLAQLVQEKVGDLARQRRQYETILSGTPDLAYIFDLNYRFTYANSALLTMWGKTWEEAEGKTCHELGYEPWHAEMHAREIDTVARTKQPYRGEVPFTGTNGRRIYDYIMIPVIGQNGEVEAVAGTTRDVTDYRANVEALQKAEERQRLALEASHSFGIWDWDVVNNLFTADERFGALFGLTPQEAKSGVALERAVAVIHPDDLERVTASIKKVLKEGGKYHEEYRVVTNGETRWISARGHVQFDEKGRPVRFPGAGVDVTREREAMNALRTANQKKDEFLATLAHELRNPLAPVRNALFMLKSDSVDAQKREQAYAIVERQVEQMVHLVDDLMDVARINTGKIELRRDSVMLGDVLNQAAEIAQPMLREYNHIFEMKIPAEPVYLDGDMVRLSQVFANLLNNSAKYSDPKGTITVDVSTEGESAVIRVSDKGIGISKEMLPHIFDMFSQVDSSIEKARGGLGIGLTITKKLVDLHGGTIEVQSAGIGKGSSFIVKLPLAQRKTTAQEKTCAALHNEARAVRVLVVDDNHASAQTLGWAVELFNCEPSICHEGMQAIERAKEFKPHVVLLDIGLPGMNGYEICKEMRKLPELNSTVFIAQTGWGQQEHRARSRDAGFHHHLVKPVDLKLLEDIIKNVAASESATSSQGQVRQAS